jgi:uncharacterized membrane protein
LVNYLNNALVLDYMKNHAYAALLISIILGILCVNISYAAIITGSIYDLSLQKESDVIIEINTIPKQVSVSKDGEYTFNVNNGNYTLHAYTELSEANESIIIDQEGNFTLDIILEDKILYLQKDIKLTDYDLNISTNNPSDNNNNNNTKNSMFTWVGGIILLIALLLIILILFLRNKDARESSKKNVVEEQLDEFEHKLLSIIKKNKRITQKDLRREIPLSEAKISLIISDLESKGKIRKIKKGRGNIIIFMKG